MNTKKLQKSQTITIHLDTNHPLLVLKKNLDFKNLYQIVKKRRQKYLKNPAAGRRPHLRVLLRVVIVRIIESCTLRKAFDLALHYAPARFFCHLGFLKWTPDFRTVFDFEKMLGKEGLKEINDYVLLTAQKMGFADIEGLCSDTTAQEASIPYPTEVGHMNSFAKSIEAGIKILGKKIRTHKDIITGKIGRIKKLARKHRLFAKTKEAKRRIEKNLLVLSNGLCRRLKEAMTQITGNTKTILRGKQKKALSRMEKLIAIFEKLSPQISYYIQHGKPIANKIISIFQPLLRAIVRGKAGKKVEFGLKWGINQIRGGYISLFLLNGIVAEPDCAVLGAKEHIRIFKKPPKDYGYDRGGWSKPHIKQIKKLKVENIGIAPKGNADWLVKKECKERIVRERAQIEGKIGTTKRFGFNKPDAKTEFGMEQAGYRSGIRSNLIRFVKDVILKNESQKK